MTRIFILAGQSNMEGSGITADIPQRYLGLAEKRQKLLLERILSNFSALKCKLFERKQEKPLHLKKVDIILEDIYIFVK